MTGKYIPYCKPDSKMAWYGRVKPTSKSENIVLNQGDIIKGCPKYVPVKIAGGDEILSKAVYYNVIVLSQSCDLAKGIITDVVVCPVAPLNDFIKANIFNFLPKEGELTHDKKGEIGSEMKKKIIAGKIKSFKHDLVKGRLLKYYLLNKCAYTEYDGDYIVVDFSSVFTVDIGLLKKIALGNKEWIRLQSPYNEGLSQAFGLAYMRVAQPIVIDRDEFMDEEIPGFIFDPLRDKNVI